MFKGLKSYEFNFQPHSLRGWQARGYKMGFKTLEEAEAYFSKQLVEFRDKTARKFPDSYTQKMKGIHGERCILPLRKESLAIASIWLSYCGNVIERGAWE